MKNLKKIIKTICPRPARRMMLASLNIFKKTRDVEKNAAFEELFKKYQEYTMIPKEIFYGNLNLIKQANKVKGCVVECGVWRGGMIAATAEILGPDKKYFLFDSFEGLPPAKENDGEKAKNWQGDTKSPTYFDNCSTDIKYSQEAMRLSGVKQYEVIKGWFSDTLPHFNSSQPIAILRIDGDWYDSTMQCLENLYKYVNDGGLIIIDDYYTWDGCTKAVHDFLSKNQLTDRICQSPQGVCYLIKKK